MGLFSTLIISIALSWANPSSGMGDRIDVINSVDVVMNLKTPLVKGDLIQIPYEIPYPGYIEFFLYDPAGERIWIDSKVREKGEHVQAFKRGPLKSGETYTFDFWYKGKKYSGKFTNG